jgi:zinc/manganese transport system ATP-binding protein/zinc transport system ATP-binding protein
MTSTVCLDNVTCQYLSGQPVLDHVSLQIEPGQFVGILGPSGSGKTTLLKTILGLVRPVHGQVTVNRKQIGYVPQVETVNWNFPVSVEQVVLMGRTGILPWPSREDIRYAREIMERLGIADLAKRHIRALSGGQQQRVFLARAMAVRPSLLILDEPTAGVDMRTQEDILHLLAGLNHDGMTILMTTHDLNAAASHLPRIICLNKQVIADGTPDEVFTPEILNATYRGDMMVVRHEGLIFVQERPHSHNYHDISIPTPVESALINSVVDSVTVSSEPNKSREIEHA